MAKDTLRTLQTALHAQIPLTQAMRVEVVALDGRGLRLKAPLEPNLNQERSAFAGSINALATLAGWGMAWSLIRGTDLEASILIQDSHIHYQHPVEQDFCALCLPPVPTEARHFLDSLRRRGRGRLSLNAEIQVGDQIMARFAGRYVASRN